MSLRTDSRTTLLLTRDEVGALQDLQKLLKIRDVEEVLGRSISQSSLVKSWSEAERGLVVDLSGKRYVIPTRANVCDHL
jgi:hypothetical protein